MKTYSTELTVRGFHIDVFGHTNHARYLEFLEIARWDVLQPVIASGFFEKRNLGFVIVNININYRSASFVNDVLHITTEMKSIVNKSIVVHQKIFDKTKGHAVCDADVTFVIMDLKLRKAVVLEGELREVFENL